MLLLCTGRWVAWFEQCCCYTDICLVTIYLLYIISILSILVKRVVLKTQIDCRIKHAGSDVSKLRGIVLWGPRDKK